MSKVRWVAVVGSREFCPLSKVREYVQSLPENAIVVTGGAQGPDLVSELAAKKCGLGVLVFYPNWEKHGKAAGYLRNKRIVEHAREVVAFWDGESRGTKHTIELAEKRGVPVTIIGETDGDAEAHTYS